MAICSYAIVRPMPAQRQKSLTDIAACKGKFRSSVIVSHFAETAAHWRPRDIETACCVYRRFVCPLNEGGATQRAEGKLEGYVVAVPSVRSYDRAKALRAQYRFYQMNRCPRLSSRRTLFSLSGITVSRERQNRRE
jgi:hypothetical protein